MPLQRGEAEGARGEALGLAVRMPRRSFRLGGVMRALKLAVLLVGQALLLLTLVGLWRRRRMRRLWLLPVHLASTTIVQTLALVVPRVFFDWTFWAWRELLLHGVTLGIVAEIALRVFAMLPEERRRARRWIGLALLLPFALLWLIPLKQPQYARATWLYLMVVEVLPRLSYGAGFVCVVLGFVIVFAHLPFDKLHWPVLAGLGGYLFIYAVSLGRQQGQGPAALLYVVTPMAYTLMLGWWCWAAWRDEKPDVGETDEASRFVHPWRH